MLSREWGKAKEINGVVFAGETRQQVASEADDN
jgi:hypothetical protein